eukprot:TRINITY_DN26273_c0_g4_i1.p1 TRINITY_DN26273_c0_g4~~TRINITY_DN26273_c0_g4_i1.p1  ORF type:complete len:287 (+),score=31.43 TRINITY_DN26273_c0_g4_i1:44-904(+)
MVRRSAVVQRSGSTAVILGRVLLVLAVLDGVGGFRVLDDHKNTSRTLPGNEEGVAVKLKYHGFKEAILTFPERMPFTFHILVAVATKVGGDAVVQTFENRSNGVRGLDWRRLAVFFTFGVFYVGLFQWFVYVDVLSDVCKFSKRFANEQVKLKLQDKNGQQSYLCEIVVDNFVHYPILYLPIFYVTKELLQGAKRHSVEAIPLGFQHFWHNIKDDVRLCWMIWIPGDLFVFAVPMWARLPSNHLVSLLWTLALSGTRGAETSVETSVETSARDPALVGDSVSVPRC